MKNSHNHSFLVSGRTKLKVISARFILTLCFAGYFLTPLRNMLCYAKNIELTRYLKKYLRYSLANFSYTEPKILYIYFIRRSVKIPYYLCNGLLLNKLQTVVSVSLSLAMNYRR